MKVTNMKELCQYAENKKKARKHYERVDRKRETQFVREN